MRPGRLILAGAAVALIGAPAAWYYGSPWWTLWRIREAARDGDPARLAYYVDYRSIAAQTAADNHTAWSSVLDTVQPDTPGKRRLLALAKRKLARRVSEASVKADAMPRLSSLPIRFLGLGAGDRGYQPYIARQRLDYFEVRDRDASLENGPVLGFHRHGLGWKLEMVRWGQQ